MAIISFENVSKTYHNGIQAVKDFNFETKNNELIVVLGPSGCGKTTLLRLIVGFEQCNDGIIKINNEVINRLEPVERGVSMVFQNYALYPQMTAYQNLSIAFRTKTITEKAKDENGNPILVIDQDKIYRLKEQIKEIKHDKKTKQKVKEIKEEIKSLKKNPSKQLIITRGYNKQEMDAQISKISKILNIDDFLYQRSSTLSGGQKQRVAIGKAMLKEPKIFLLDEPFSNLDPKLHKDAQELILKVHKKIKATTILVTHEQKEALAIADRIIVMNNGEIVQVGTPEEIYSNPSDSFVAGFVGNVAMNLFEADFKNDEIIFGDNLNIKLNKKEINLLNGYQKEKIILGIRSEDISVVPIKESKNIVNFEFAFDYKELLTFDTYLYGKIFDSKIVIKLNEDCNFEKEEKITAFFDKKSIFLYDIETKKLITNFKEI